MMMSVDEDGFSVIEITYLRNSEILTSFVALGCCHSGYADACTTNGAFENGRASVRMEQPVLLGLLND